MLGDRNGAIKVFPIQLAEKLTLLLHQLAIGKLSTNLLTLEITHLLALILFFATT